MIYLDHHAASPIDERVHRAMDDARAQAWANPASAHRAGQRARAVLEQARTDIASAVGAQPADLVFTSGGTEACNLGVFGLGEGIGRVITTAIEHPAVGQAVDALGVEVVVLGVEEGRAPAAEELERELARSDAPTLVAIQWINHETGTILPVEQYAQVCRARQSRFFVDATQALGKLAVDVTRIGASAVALASTKVGGPTGAGALWVDRTVELRSQLRGGMQERGRRAGTSDPVTMAGFAAACRLAPTRLAAMGEVARRRDRLESRLVAAGGSVNGGAGARVATVSNVSVRGWRGRSLVAALDLEGVCASSGAACSSGVDAPSPVIQAMHPSELWRAESALRLSLGASTTDKETDDACVILDRVLARKRDSASSN